MFDPLSYRPTGRVAVRIVAAIALVSVATGILSILTDPTLEAAGPLADLQATAEFSGTVVGFALLVAAWGMRRGYRIAYLTAGALVLLAAAHGVVQLRLLSVPLIVLSIGGLAVLALTSTRFTRSSRLDLSPTQFGSFVAIVGVFCYGVAGAYTLRNGFAELETVVDAVYFTLATASTVGYGDIHPTTEAARLFAVSLLLLGPTTVAVAVGSLFGPAIETRLARTGRRVTNHHPSDTDRVAVLGLDEITVAAVERLADRTAVTVTVAASDEKRLQGLPDSVEGVVGEPTADETLERVDLGACDAVVLAASEEPALASVARATTDARVIAIAGGSTAPDLEGRADAVIDPLAVAADATTAATLGESDAAAQSSASAASHSG
ncbi:ion channel [Natronococcus sp. A-GB1]|uniref:ion channel n=1 Tax=Natronococcus sp. A-GB1 TaxID=3037648 RepID=UPI00241F2B65|nr:ion channel [Natronococcus sp. A-GB1]MDG5758990.1 ion channel [Natronococcus sp. A-GB1]